MIGRAPELEALRLYYERAGNGRGALVLLWGEAGVGKTRLLEEFAPIAHASGAQIATAGCFESLCPPFAPIREVFAGLGLRDPFEIASSVAPVQATESARYRAFSLAAEALKNSSPRILILDDLQWADFATLEFLSFLLSRLASLPVLVLGAVRSEHLERDHARQEQFAGLERRGAATLNVTPLRKPEIRALVNALWPKERAFDERAIERVCALAEGKPYFAEELVDTLTGREEAADAAPLSIRAGVLARFERLTVEARRILLYASVIGRNFDVSLLEAVSGSANSDVCDALAAARALQLVAEARDRVGAFAFRHAITREILYHELLAVQARAIHRDVANRLTQEPGADPLDLAYHWNAAGDRERASEAYERAGDAAYYRSAHRDASVAYRGAVATRNETDPGYPFLCEKFSRALSANAQIDDACAFAERAVNGYEAAGESERAASLAIRLARRTYENGNPQAAAQIGLRALRLSGERGPVAYDSYVTLAHFEALQGKNDAAAVYLASAEEVPGEHSALDRRNAYMVRAIVAATSGRLIEAFEHYEAAAAIAREVNDPEQLAWTLNNYASRAMATGWMDRARDAHREAAACLSGDEFAKVRASTLQGLAFAELLEGDLASVDARQRESERLPPGIAMTRDARVALTIRFAYYRGDDATAMALVTPEMLEGAFDSGEAQRIGLLAGCAAACYDAVGRRNEARALRSRALERIRTVDFSFWLLDQLAAGETPGDRGRARALLAEAATDPGNRAARAFLSLFDARIAQRERSAEARALAVNAASVFEVIGWPWERAQALEIAGRTAEALELYRRYGFLRHARAVEQQRRRARHRPGRRELTAREFEVAALAAEGKTNRAIAAELFIGERTVETHIAAIFDRFELTSRRELAALLEDIPKHP
ncbi:MAG TPA: AAA family ATPase [Candidatus Cybelea sp.]